MSTLTAIGRLELQDPFTSSLGLPEVILLPIVALGAAMPIATFVLVLLTYRKVSQLGKRHGG